MKRISPAIKNLVIAIICLVFVSSIFYYKVETWSLVDSFYFTVLTITTVGHAGLIPTTILSKLFTTVVAFVGIAMVLTLFGIVSSHYVRLVTNGKNK